MHATLNNRHRAFPSLVVCFTITSGEKHGHLGVLLTPLLKDAKIVTPKLTFKKKKTTTTTQALTPNFEKIVWLTMHPIKSISGHKYE